MNIKKLGGVVDATKEMAPTLDSRLFEESSVHGALYRGSLVEDFVQSARAT